MIKTLQWHILFKKASAISLCSGIHTGTTLSARFRKRNKHFPDDPGVRGGMDTYQDGPDFPEEILDEEDLHSELDLMNADQIYDEFHREEKRFKDKVQLKITAQKFFSPRPQPSMLTYNERLCIKHLHKEDPVQWDLKTLSESFPATTDTIKKIIKQNRKFTLEIIQKMDIRVQKNWDLLAEGKLDADPHVLRHLKKFINRRHILLEQIKNEKFYLPEIKRECVWNQGQMSSIIHQYEKAIESMIEENSPKALTDGAKEVEIKKKEEKTSIKSIPKKMHIDTQNLPEAKDSFMYGKIVSKYTKQTTLAELEDEILKKAEMRKKLNPTEESIMKHKMGINTHSIKNYDKSFTSTHVEKELKKSWSEEIKVYGKLQEPVEFEYDSMEGKRTEPKEFSVAFDYAQPVENTLFGCEGDIGKILNELQGLSKSEDESRAKNEVKSAPSSGVKNNKKEIYFSDPERLKREDIYFENEVAHIRNTAFWNNNRTNQEKQMAELNKRDHDGPVTEENFSNKPKMFVLSLEPYPDRIKVPKNKKGTGVTFKIKDCYYDDDGEFLYRVPGMTK